MSSDRKTMVRTALLAASLGAGLSLSGCATPDGDFYMGGPDNFGEANRMTMAAQVIDPDPVYDTPLPEGHAEHAGQAVERYREDKVKQPDRTRTSKSLTGSGSGSGGN
ncbi:hypothetical protein [Novosphingobium aureum]|nr:hypothetical protein [Novosphingobium aureum]